MRMYVLLLGRLFAKLFYCFPLALPLNPLLVGVPLNVPVDARSTWRQQGVPGQGCLFVSIARLHQHGVYCNKLPYSVRTAMPPAPSAFGACRL